MSFKIGGMMSGMDTDSIVQQMMELERAPMNRLMQQQQTLEWQRDDYRTINTTLLNFSNKLFDMGLSSFYRGRSTSVSNEGIVSAVAGSGASMSSYSISNITQLAKAAQRISGEAIAEGKIKTNQSLYSIKDEFSNNNFDWKQGVIESKTLSGGGTEFEIGKEITDPANVSVKVDGKSYEVVTDRDQLGEGKVFVGADGSVEFSKAISSKSKVKVDYAAEEASVDRTITKDTKTISLGAKSLVAESVSLEVDGLTYTVNEDNELVNGNVKLGTINLESGTVSLDTDWKEARYESEDDDDTTFDLTASYKQNYFTFGVESENADGKVRENFLMAGSESLSTVMSKVNQSKAGVTMFYDEHTNRVVMSNKTTGDFKTTVTGGFMEDVLKVGSSAQVSDGQNAKFTVNGLETERTSNTFTMNNVTFTLNRTTEGQETSQVNVNNDTDKVFENIMSFVEEYNKVVDEIQTKTNEQRNKSYQPLTEDERNQLSDREVEKWDDLAKSGLLRRDPILTNTLSSMRTSIYSPVNNPEMSGLINSLSQIGITTTADYNDGKLVVDEAKLKKAIEENPDDVEKLFTGGDGEKGIIKRIRDDVDGARSRLRTKAGNASSINHQYTIGRELNSIEDQIERFKTRLQKVEDRYWKQFSAMETAMQRADAQMSQLMGALGGLQQF